MKTKLKTFIQKVQAMPILFAVLFCIGIVFVGSVAWEGKAASASSTVKAAKLTKKNKKARKAYQKLLAGKEFQRTKEKKLTYAVIDLDGNGIDELFIDSGGIDMAGMYCQLYTFQKGKVKKLLEVYRESFIVYEDGTLEYSMGHMDHMEDRYYRLKNGTLQKLMRLYGYWPGTISKSKRKKAEYKEGMYWTTRKIGKKQVSYDDCQKWEQDFQAKHKTIKVKYYKNTASNRKSLYQTAKSTVNKAATNEKAVKVTHKYKTKKVGSKRKIILYGKSKNGKVVWKFSSPYVPLTESSDNDYFINKNIIYLFSAKLYAINKATGKVKWIYDYQTGSPSVAFDKKGNLYFTGHYEDGLNCISPKGQLKFEVKFPGDYHWPYKVKIVSGKIRAYIEDPSTGKRYYAIYNKKGKYLGKHSTKL